MKSLSLLVLIGAALAIPSPRQLLSHGPIVREVLDTRGTAWNNGYGSGGLPPIEGEEKVRRANSFRVRANEMIESTLMKKDDKSILSRSTDGPSARDAQAESITWKGQNKNWKKGRGQAWTKIPTPRARSAEETDWHQQSPGTNHANSNEWGRRDPGTNSARENDWGRQAPGINSAEDDGDSVRITRRVLRTAHT